MICFDGSQMNYSEPLSTADEARRATVGINLDDFMRPAVTRGLWVATLAASAILVIGLSSIRLTTRPRSG